MANDEELKIRISADLKELKQGMAAARLEIDKLGRTRNLGVSKEIDKVSASAKGASINVAGLATAFASLFALRGTAKLADDIANTNARLRIATKSAEEFKIAQAGVTDIAIRTGSTIRDTSELYARFSRATKEAGVSQGELLRITETINKAVQLSGASAESATAALVQLSQGIASGTLRGEELNSVMEQTPRLAQALADGLGVGIGALREMGQQGQITSDVLIKALSSQAEAVDKEFSQLPMTIGRATQMLKNVATDIVGIVDSSTGSSAEFAQTIASFAERLNNIDMSGLVQFVETSGEALATVADGLDEVAEVALDTAEIFGEALIMIGDAFGAEIGEGSQSIDALDFLAFSIKNLPALTVAAIQELTVNLASFAEKAYVSAVAVRDRIKAVFSDDTIEEVNDRWIAELERIEKVRQDSIASIREETSANVAAGEAAAERYRKEREARRKALEEARALAAKAKADGVSGGTVGTGTRQAVADAAAIAKAETENALKEIDRLYAAGNLRASEYFAQKRRLASEITRLEIEQINAKLAAEKDAEAQSKLLTEREIARRRGAARQADIAAEEQKENERRLRDAEELQIQLLKVEERGAEARAKELELQYRETLNRMRLEGDQAGIDIINKIINAEVGRARLAEIERDYQRTLENLKTREESLADQVQTGSLDPSVAQDELGTAQQEAIISLQQYREQLRLLAEQEVPGAAEALAELDAKIREVTIDSATGAQAAIGSLRAQLNQMDKDLAKNVAGAGVNALEGFFMDIAEGSKSADDALKDFARGFVRSMAQIASQALATFLVLRLLDSIYPGLGQATAATMSAGANVKHTGGVVGRGGTVRQVNPMLFAAAPRYHTGGVAGLKPGEVPAILQTGEEVLSRDDPRNVTNGGGQQQQNNGVRIINVVDPSLVSDYMSSSSGERVLMNLIEKNSGQIKQVLS